MRRTFLTLFLLITLLPTWNLTAMAQSNAPSGQEPASGSIVCPPGVYPIAPDDCLPLGPSEYLAQTTAQGIPYPILPLPAYSPDKSLNDLPYQYFKVSNAGASLYPSLDAAAANQPSKILYPSKDIYVSYKGAAVPVGQESYYQLLSGYWVAAEGGRLGKFDPVHLRRERFFHIPDKLPALGMVGQHDTDRSTLFRNACPHQRRE